MSNMSIDSHAQVWLPGFFINNNNDTTHVEISSVPYSSGMGFQIRCKDKLGDIRTITPYTVCEVHYIENRKEVKLVSVENSLKFPGSWNKPELKVFLRTVVEDYLTLYQFMAIRAGIAGYPPVYVESYECVFILKRAQEELYLITKKEELLNYLSSAPPRLSGKLHDCQFGILHFRSIENG